MAIHLFIMAYLTVLPILTWLECPFKIKCLVSVRNYHNMIYCNLPICTEMYCDASKHTLYTTLKCILYYKTKLSFDFFFDEHCGKPVVPYDCILSDANVDIDNVFNR
jgi:hypothetical protein